MNPLIEYQMIILQQVIESIKRKMKRIPTNKRKEYDLCKDAVEACHSALNKLKLLDELDK